MKEAYRAARKEISKTGKLAKSNVLNLINTIIRRKHMTVTAKQVFMDIFLTFLPCKSRKAKRCIVGNSID